MQELSLFEVELVHQLLICRKLTLQRGNLNRETLDLIVLVLVLLDDLLEVLCLTPGCLKILLQCLNFIILVFKVVNGFINFHEQLVNSFFEIVLGLNQSLVFCLQLLDLLGKLWLVFHLSDHGRSVVRLWLDGLLRLL